MSKFCMKCGKELSDDDLHCKYCGASLENKFDTSDKKHSEASSSGGGGVLVPIVAAVSVVLVVLIVVLDLTVFNISYKDPIDYVCEAMESGDADYLEDALPDFIVKSDDYDKDDLEDVLDEMSDLLGEDPEVSYDVVSKKEIDDDDLEELEDEIEKKYDKSVDIDNGYNVKIELTIENDDGENTQKMTVPVYEIDGKWCIFPDAGFGKGLDFISK